MDLAGVLWGRSGAAWNPYNPRMAGKGNTPLFEAIQRSSKSNGIAMHRPAIPPLEPARAGKTGTRSVRVPEYAIYIAITLALGIGIGIWAVAFEVGRRSGEQATLQRLGLLDPEPKQDPIEELLARSEEAEQVGVPVADPLPEAPARVILASGESRTDPRESATNYLKIASGVSEEEARGAIAFLAEHGIEAMGRLVDEGTSDANNPARYDLFCLTPVPSHRYGELRALREELQQKVARLGQQWRRAPHRGTVDFARSIWVRYDGT